MQHSCSKLAPSNLGQHLVLVSQVPGFRTKSALSFRSLSGSSKRQDTQKSTSTLTRAQYKALAENNTWAFQLWTACSKFPDQVSMFLLGFVWDTVWLAHNRHHTQTSTSSQAMQGKDLPRQMRPESQDLMIIWPYSKKCSISWRSPEASDKSYFKYKKH